jgi:glycopeptide antibiotics resistance protein
MKRHILATIGLIAYCAILIKVMVFKDIPMIRIGQLMLNFGGTNSGHAPNFIPFTTIMPYLLGHKGLIIAGINLVGNVALLVPLGLLLPLAFKNITWKQSLLIAIASGLAIETLQTILKVGIFDIDDVILNALGVMVGYWMFIVFARWMRSKSYIKILVAVAVLIAVPAASLYLIYPKDMPVMPGAGEVRTERFNTGENQTVEGVDPCGGTGGTGEIVAIENRILTLKRNDGVSEPLKLTDQTVFESSAGPIAESALKAGDRVTVVVYEDQIATAVMVCATGE